MQINKEQLMKLKSKIVIIDVRRKTEYDNGHLPNAINIDFYSPDFINKLNALEKSKEYMVYCRKGGRSSKTQAKMNTLGFKTVYNLLGGYLKWIDS